MFIKKSTTLCLAQILSQKAPEVNYGELHTVLYQLARITPRDLANWQKANALTNDAAAIGFGVSVRTWKRMKGGR